MRFRKTELFARVVPTALVTALSIATFGCMQQDASSFFAQAKLYEQKGDANAAVIQLKNGLQKNPNDGEARFLLGTIYADAHENLAAESEFRKAAAAGVATQRVLPALGRVLLALEQYQKALTETEAESAAGLKNNAEILAIRGSAFLGLNRIADARQAFQQSLDVLPDNAPALVGAAKAAGFAHEMDRAAELSDLAIARHPTDVDAWMLRGDLTRAAGKTAASLPAYQEAAKLQPKNVVPKVALANAQIGLQQYDAAKANLDAARKLRPNSLLTFYTQGLLDYSQGKLALAMESLQQVLRAAPTYMPAVLLTGVVQFAMGSNEQAEQNLRKYLAADPSSLYARKALASLLLKTGRADQAGAMTAAALKDAPEDQQLLLIAGESSLQKKQYSTADQYFEKAKLTGVQPSLVHTALAVSRLEQGDQAKAISELEIATSQDDKSSQVGILLVTTLLREKQFDKALKAVNKLEAQAPKNPEVENLKGAVLTSMQDNATARSSFEKALLLSPNYMPAVLNLARLDLIEAHPEAAKKRFETVLQTDNKNIGAMIALAKMAQAAGQAAEATAWYEKASAENPSNIGATLQLGAHYLQTGAKEKALALSRKASAANDGNPDLLDFLGRSQAANNDLRGALATFQKLVSVKPDSPVVHMRLATVYAAMKNQPEAIASLNKAIAIQPDNLEAQSTLFTVYGNAGEFDAALKVARQVQKQRPKMPVGFVMEGDILMAQKKPALALKMFDLAAVQGKSAPLMIKQHAAALAAGETKKADEKAVQWLKENPQDNMLRVYFAHSLAVRKLTKAAIEQFETAIKISPDNAIVLNSLAIAYQQDKDPRAVTVADQALKLAPTNPAIMDTLGWILVGAGNDPRGLELLRKASTQLPTNEEIRFHLATALLKSGDKTNARKQLEILAASKTFPGTEEAKRLLKEL